MSRILRHPSPVGAALAAIRVWSRLSRPRPLLQLRKVGNDAHGRHHNLLQ